MYQALIWEYKQQTKNNCLSLNIEIEGIHMSHHIVDNMVIFFPLLDPLSRFSEDNLAVTDLSE